MRRYSRHAAPGRTLSALLHGPARTWLLLVGAAILPLLLFGGWVGYLAAIETRAETGRIAAAAIDGAASRIAAELAAQLDIVRALAASTALDAPDLTAFRTEAERVRAQHPLWRTIELALPSGPQVLNLLRGPGERLGETADEASLHLVVATGRVAVGGIGPVGPISGRRLVTLRAPVIRDGKLTFVLSVAVTPDGIGTLLRNTGVPSEWIGVVLDREGRIVARTEATAQDEGQLASAPLRAAIAAAPAGALLGRTREGLPVETAYRSLSGADGWVVAFGIPRAMLERPVRRALLLLVGEGCAGLVLAALLTSAVARDVAQRRADDTERAARSGRQQAETQRLGLLRDMALAQEEERRRIARELHDQVGQTVTGLSLGLKTLETSLAGPASDPAIKERLTWLRSLAADIGQDIHRAAADLRPAALDDFGLPAALSALARDLGERHHITVDIQIIGAVERLSPAVEMVIYRVVQEALTNTLKHAGAATASVLLERRADAIKLIVEDDGAGFDPDQVPPDGRPRLGLSGIKERLRLVAGSLELETAAGAGTTLFVSVPLGAAERA